MAHRARGFSLLELAVIVMVIALVGGFLLQALGRYQGQAERQAVDLVVKQIRMGLQLHQLDAMTYGRREELTRLSGSNPILLRGASVDNYLGEFATPPAPDATGWYFDTASRELVYRPRSAAFEFREGEHGELHWQLREIKGSEFSVRFQEVGLRVP